jgi:hypothetical protein
VTGVGRGWEDLRPGTVRTTGLCLPKTGPSRNNLMMTLFISLNHHGGRIRWLLAMAATVVGECETNFTLGRECEASFTIGGR